MMNNNNKVKRGEIYMYDFGIHDGSIQSGIRPVLVVQCDQANNASTTTVVASLTSVIKKRYLPSHIILGRKFGLKEPSMVMLEQLQTVNQSSLIRLIGFVDDENMLRKINIGIKNAMGLWVDRPLYRKSDVRCLCNNCLADYMESSDYIVKRVDPFEKIKQKCDKCPSYGYDYIIIDRADMQKK